MTCADMDPLLAGRVLAELDTSRAATLDQHLGGCPLCRDRLAALEAWRRQPADPPASRWDELAARIEADRVRPVRVALTCSYCHDGLGRKEAAYCAGCLAPHHADCFAEHGSCSTPGCGETRLVRAGRPVTPGRARRAGWLLVAALVGSAGTIAALAPWRGARPERTAPETPALAPFAVVPPVAVHVEPQRAKPIFECRPASAGKIDIRAVDANVRLVFEEIARVASRSIIVAPDVRGDVTLDLHDVGWQKVIVAIAKTVGDYEVVEETPDVLRIVPRSSLALELETRVYPLGSARSEDVQNVLTAMIDGTKASCPGSWFAFTRDAVVVNANHVILKRVETLLQQLARPEPLPLPAESPETKPVPGR